MIIPNIGPRGQRQRRTLGLVSLAVAVLLAGVLVAAGVPRAWRAVVFVPLWLSALGFFQAREKT